MGSKSNQAYFCSSSTIKNNGMDTTEPCKVSMKSSCGRSCLRTLFPEHPLLASIIDSALVKLDVLVFSVNPKRNVTRPSRAY